MKHADPPASVADRRVFSIADARHFLRRSHRLPAVRFTHLSRLGFLRPISRAGTEAVDLRRDLETVAALEVRLGTLGGEDLTPAARRGALAWLASAAREDLRRRPGSDGLGGRASEVLAVLEERLR